MLPVYGHILPAYSYSLSEEEVALQQQYSRLCSEKCRLLSSIEANTRAGRLLQKEVHRILDFLGEVVPVCQLSSLSEGEDHDWFYESDEEIIAEEHRRENCIIASLKAQRTRHQRSNSPRRRSVSPERRPTSKPRRNYKNLPLKNDGEIDYPVVLGRGIFRTTVLDAGQIDASDKFRNEMYVYPVGFIAKRKYNALESHDKKAIYFCSISKSADGLPQFEISTNNPQMRRLGNHESGAAADPGITLAFDNDIKALWNCFRNRFVPALQVSLDEEFPEPEAFFGLQHESLVKYYKDQLEMDAK